MSVQVIPRPSRIWPLAVVEPRVDLLRHLGPTLKLSVLLSDPTKPCLLPPVLPQSTTLSPSLSPEGHATGLEVVDHGGPRLVHAAVVGGVEVGHHLHGRGAVVDVQAGHVLASVRLGDDAGDDAAGHGELPAPAGSVDSSTLPEGSVIWKT